MLVRQLYFTSTDIHRPVKLLIEWKSDYNVLVTSVSIVKVLMNDIQTLVTAMMVLVRDYNAHIIIVPISTALCILLYNNVSTYVFFILENSILAQE